MRTAVFAIQSHQGAGLHRYILQSPFFNVHLDILLFTVEQGSLLFSIVPFNEELAY